MVWGCVAVVVVFAIFVWARSVQSPSAPQTSVRNTDLGATGTPDEEPTRNGASVSRDPAVVTAEPTVLSGVAPSTDPDEVTAGKPADSLAEPFVEASSEALAVPSGLDPDTAVTVSSDSALAALMASVAEYQERDWAQVGSPSVVSTQVRSIDRDTEQPTAVLEVCLDYTSVDIVDANGDSVRDPDAAPRVLTLFDMQFVDGRWVLVSQTFSDDITC